MHLPVWVGKFFALKTGAFQNFAPYPLPIGEGRVRQLENEILKHTPQNYHTRFRSIFIFYLLIFKGKSSFFVYLQKK
jgi:hypothetical protein